MPTAAALPIALALLSAITVAAANFAVKRGGDVLTARMILSVTMGLSVLPFAFFVPMPPAHLWTAVIGAVAVHWFYQFCLIRSLHRGDLSLVFPVQRGLAPIIVGITAYIFLKETLSPLSMIGLLVVSAAIIIFALPTGATADKRKLDRTALFWAGGTALGIGFYSVVDASVMRAMPHAFTFPVWLFLLDWIGITAVTLWTRRGEVVARCRPQMKAAVLGGIAGTISYTAALLAWRLSDQTALVTAIRETSVLFGALLGWWFLKEGFGRRRVAAAAAVATGVILMQIGSL